MNIIINLTFCTWCSKYSFVHTGCITSHSFFVLVVSQAEIGQGLSTPRTDAPRVASVSFYGADIFLFPRDSATLNVDVYFDQTT